MGFSLKKFTKKAVKTTKRATRYTKKWEKSLNRLGIKDMAIQGGLQSLNAIAPGAGTMAGNMHQQMLQAKAMANQYGATDVMGTIGDILMNPSVAHAPMTQPGGVPAVMSPNHALTVSRAVGGQTDKAGRPLMVTPSHRTVRSVPRGYVVVRHPTMGTVGMLRSTAVSAGLYKPRKKPPISAGDWNKMKVADRVKRNVKKVASTAGFTAAPKGRRTVRK